MSERRAHSEFLVLSRGHWDAEATPEEIQSSIDAFYVWHDRLVREGRFKPGQRLGVDTRLVSRKGVIDGPFAEAKEVVGGYWFVYATDLDEAASIAAGNPTLVRGLSFEVRPTDPVKARASDVTCETPPRR